MEVDYLIIGAGISGLSFAARVQELARGAAEPPSVLVLEKEPEPGGYCRTVKQDGFVWDYSGHFFHFKHKDIEQWLRDRMPGQEIFDVVKKSSIRHQGNDIDFPFQKNIHQLPKDDLIDCLYGLFTRPEVEQPKSFREMLESKFGRGICERFLFPYNEKLYATDLNALDPNAMGRFFPYADPVDIIRNMKAADNESYNARFTYPAGGAIEYVRAFLSELDDKVVRLSTEVTRIDVDSKVASTSAGNIRFKHLITSTPFPKLCAMCSVPVEDEVLTSNKVLVFNMGFDKPSRRDEHWMYFPDDDVRFYRVGFYDNIQSGDRMSLYVEIGARTDEPLDVHKEKARVLADLEREGIIDGHRLMSDHHVVLDPAYVHITQRSISEVERIRGDLSPRGIHSVGRYGGWTYCAIEDNIVETRALADEIYPATL